MILSFSSFMGAAIAITVLICILRILISKTKIISHMGIYSILFFLLVILARALMPFEFRIFEITKSYYSYKFLPAIYTFIKQPLFSLLSLKITLSLILQIVWGCGALAFLFLKAWRYHRFKIVLSHIPSVDKTSSSYHIFTKAATAVFPKKNINCRIVYADFFNSPAVFGQKQPTIILPTISYSDEELYYVFAHELLHIKHKDFWIKSICDLIIAVYWWNPIIILFLPSVMNQILELSVDASLNTNRDKNDTVTYLNCLQKTLLHQTNKIPSNIQPLVSNTSKKQLIQRFSLLTQKRIHRYSFFSFVIVISLFLLSFTFVFEPSYSPTIDETGNEVFEFNPDNSYYIKNGSGYDFYMDGRFAAHLNEPEEYFGKLPIYNSKEEVPK